MKLTTVLGFFRKEFRQALRDPRMRFMLIVMPVVQLTLFGLALSSDVRNIRLAINAEMNDPLFFTIGRDALGGGWFVKADRSPKVEAEGFDEIRSGRSEVALFAPEGGLTRGSLRGDGDFQALIDSVNLTRARSIDHYLKAITNEGLRDYTGRGVPQPLRFDIRLLYNPELVSAYYLVPGVLCMLICIITIMLTSMSIAKEKEVGTFETLIAAPVSVTEILLGKTVPFLIIGSLNLPLVMGIAIAGFGVPMRGGVGALIIATIFFLVTTVSIGTLISTIARNQQQAMMGGFIFIMPAILLSGIMFPIENMPWVMRIVAYGNPLMYFITLLRNIMLKGGEPIVIAQNTVALGAISLICAATAFKKFRLHLG